MCVRYDWHSRPLSVTRTRKYDKRKKKCTVQKHTLNTRARRVETMRVRRSPAARRSATPTRRDGDADVARGASARRRRKTMVRNHGHRDHSYDVAVSFLVATDLSNSFTPRQLESTLNATVARWSFVYVMPIVLSYAADSLSAPSIMILREQPRPKTNPAGRASGQRKRFISDPSTST